MHLCGQKLTLADLSAYPFISLGRETVSYAFAYNLFAENGAAFSPDIEVATSDQILPLVRLDLGVAFLPEAFAAPALQKGEIGRLTLAETIPPRQLLMARRSGQALSHRRQSAGSDDPGVTAIRASGFRRVLFAKRHQQRPSPADPRIRRG